MRKGVVPVIRIQVSSWTTYLLHQLPYFLYFLRTNEDNDAALLQPLDYPAAMFRIFKMLSSNKVTFEAA